MSKSILQLLQAVVSATTRIAPPAHQVDGHQWSRQHNIFRGNHVADGSILCVTHAGAKPLQRLTEFIFTGSKRFQRGCTYNELSTKVFNLVLAFADRVPKSVSEAEAVQLMADIESWFSTTTRSQTNWILCDITPYPAEPFRIGPVKFRHLDTSGAPAGLTDEFTIGRYNAFTAEGRHSGARWVAEVEIHGCLPRKSSELAALTVDLAITAVQLVMPGDDRKYMARLERRYPPSLSTFSVSDGQILGGSSNRQPGRTVHNSVFDQIILERAQLLSDIGENIQAFANDPAGPSILTRNWCEAAYWYHEGISESIDSIAVAKLETSLEVLFTAQNTSGSEARILQAISAFLGWPSSHLIQTNPDLTVKRFVKGLVEGRSRVLHGTLSTLESHMRDPRASLAQLSELFLQLYCSKLRVYEALADKQPDTTEAFLRWVAADRVNANAQPVT